MTDEMFKIIKKAVFPNTLKISRRKMSLNGMGYEGVATYIRGVRDEAIVLARSKAALQRILHEHYKGQKFDGKKFTKSALMGRP